MRRSLLLILFISTVTGLLAQDSYNSFWGTLEIEKEFSKKFSLEFEEEYRYFFNIGTTNRFMTSLDGSYSINKWLNTGIGYTWIYDHNYKKEYYTNRNRLGIWIKAQKKWGNFNLSLREKCQIDYRDETKKESEYNPHTYLRSKLELSYKLKPLNLEPFFTTQIRYQLNNPEGNNIDNVRTAIGTEYALTKKIKLQIYYLYDKELNVNKPDRDHVFGTSIKFKI